MTDREHKLLALYREKLKWDCDRDARGESIAHYGMDLEIQELEAELAAPTPTPSGEAAPFQAALEWMRMEETFQLRWKLAGDHADGKFDREEMEARLLAAWGDRCRREGIADAIDELVDCAPGASYPSRQTLIESVRALLTPPAEPKETK